MSGPWFEERPGVLAEELQALSEAGIRFEEDPVARANGVLRLRIEVPQETGEPLSLVATYPDSYPFFRPVVAAPTLSLARHQHPFAHNLCLIGRNTAHWDSNTTLAKHLRDQLPEVLRKGNITDPEILKRDVTEQAEPYSDYYAYHEDAMVLVDPAIQAPSSAQRGTLILGLPETGGIVIRGAVIEVFDDSGNGCGRIDDSVASLFPQRVDVPWIRVPVEFGTPKPEGALEYLRTAAPDILRSGRIVGREEGKVRVIAFIFQEEVAPGEKSDAWLFLIRATSLNRARRLPEELWYFARSGRFSAEHLLLRTPELAPLRNSTVALAGLGCVGAPVALELARAGIGELRLLDHDYIDPGSTVRWPLGIAAAGKFKVEALKSFLRTNYPFTKVVAFRHAIGIPRDTGQPEWEVIDEFTKDASMVIDATAEFGVHHFLSHVARWLSIPYLCAYGTNGGWGGEVVRILPGETACWNCFGRAQEAGKIPKAPENRNAGLQPAGCADPTFTGAAFDLAQISLAATRMAVATLCHAVPGGYPDLDWDVGVLALRNAEGHPIPPRWDTCRLRPDADCPTCR